MDRVDEAFMEKQETTKALSKNHRGYYEMPTFKLDRFQFVFDVDDENIVGACESNVTKNFAVRDTVFWESDPAGTVKRLYDDVDKDIRGVPRSRYRELARQKENEHNVRPLYSKGFYRQELFNSVEYVDSFTGKKTDIDDEIDGLKKAGCEIVEIENDKDQTRIWFILHEKQKLKVFPGDKSPNNILKATGFNQHGEKVHRVFQGFPNTPEIYEGRSIGCLKLK